MQVGLVLSEGTRKGDVLALLVRLHLMLLSKVYVNRCLIYQAKFFLLTHTRSHIPFFQTSYAIKVSTLRPAPLSSTSTPYLPPPISPALYKNPRFILKLAFFFYFII